MSRTRSCTALHRVLNAALSAPRLDLLSQGGAGDHAQKHVVVRKHERTTPEQNARLIMQQHFEKYASTVIYRFKVPQYQYTR